MNVSQAIHDLTTLAIKNGRIEEADRIYQQNNLLRVIGGHELESVETTETADTHVLLDTLLSAAKDNGVITDMVNVDMIGALIMDSVTPLPSQVNHMFWHKYHDSPEAATHYFYNLSKQNDYIKTRSIAKNIHYVANSKYGELEITINLSKPEKDPKAIAAALKMPQNMYPECALCVENEGYFGSLNQAARSNHRIINLKLGGEEWGFQYSPYAYFNEHAIVLNREHRPMTVSKDSLMRLADFIEQFPSYMIGSNADLPIVGGSILTHDHYQAGRHEFPMARAEIRKTFKLVDFPDVDAGIVNWPMSVIRLRADQKERLVAAGELIRTKWNEYDALELGIKAYGDDGVRHHTVTPIMRMRDGKYELDLVLRDNNTSDTYPDGIFHPHQDVQHIKKENIGLIEVMGLAILPPRLIAELAEVKKFLLNQPSNVKKIHQTWADMLKQGSYTQESVDDYLNQALADAFTRVLEDAGVFKTDAGGQAGFDEFIASLR